MLTADRFAGPEEPATDTLALPYEARLKSRQCLGLADGREFGYHLPPGTQLRHGDKLLAEDRTTRRVVEILAADEVLLEVRVADVLEFARAAYHLGNRHVRVELGADVRGRYLRLQPDHVIGEMLARLGCEMKEVTAPFQPEGGAYGGHGHGRTLHRHGEGHGPHIHEFR